MKFRIKFNTQTNLMTFDQSTIEQLKAQIQIQFSSLKKANFHLSLNGKDILDEKQTISQSTLVNGDTIYILTENSPTTIDQPLTLDEVRDPSHIYPIQIHRLIECSQPDNDFDYMIIVIHALMVENGFQMVKKLDLQSNILF